MDLGTVPVSEDETEVLEAELATATIVDTISASISTITPAVLSPNLKNKNVTSSRIDIGQHPTPPMQKLTINESSYEDGYDSDGQVGPFYDSVFGIDPITFHEDAILDQEPTLNADGTSTIVRNENDTRNSDNSKFSMSDAEIMSLRKPELMEQCKLLGLDKRGNKEPLQERLKKARTDGICYLTNEQLDNPEIQQLANDGFSPHTIWEYLEAVDELVDLTDELELDGVKYRAPTTPREEFERTGVGSGGQKKFNFSRKIHREKFVKKALVPKTDSRGRVLKDRLSGQYIYEEKEIQKSVPNITFIKNHQLSYTSEPFEWFNAFVPFKKSRTQANRDGPWTIGEWTRNTNLKAMLSNAGSGGTIYKDFTLFTTFELMKHVGVYFLNGVSPSPRV